MPSCSNAFLSLKQPLSFFIACGRVLDNAKPPSGVPFHWLLRCSSCWRSSAIGDKHHTHHAHLSASLRGCSPSSRIDVDVPLASHHRRFRWYVDVQLCSSTFVQTSVGIIDTSILSIVCRSRSCAWIDGDTLYFSKHMRRTTPTDASDKRGFTPTELFKTHG